MRMNENRKSTRVLMLETPGRLAENAGAPSEPQRHDVLRCLSHCLRGKDKSMISLEESHKAS